MLSDIVNLILRGTPGLPGSGEDGLVSDQLQIRFEFLDELGRNSASLKIWRFTWLQLWLAGFEMCILEIVTSPDDSTLLAALEVLASV